MCIRDSDEAVPYFERAVALAPGNGRSMYDAGNTYRRPVSYTHLDVYKRQAHISRANNRLKQLLDYVSGLTIALRRPLDLRY